MADSKAAYSTAAYNYDMRTRHFFMPDAMRYYRSKLRELKYNDNWKNNMVVSRFTPGAKGRTSGVKYEFKSDKYVIKVDMPSGYLRIQNRKTGDYLKLDGSPGSNEETHFKVKKRREM